MRPGWISLAVCLLAASGIAAGESAPAGERTGARYETYVLWLTVVWPIVLTALPLVLMRHRLRRPVAFTLVSLGGGYAGLIGSNYLATLAISPLANLVAGGGVLAVGSVAVLAIAFVYLIPALVMLVVFRQFRTPAPPAS